MHRIDQIVVGSTLEQNRTFDRDSLSLCVIHLIDPNSIVNNAQEMEEYITDQIIEIWNSLRDGDLIEDTNTKQVYAVVQDDLQDDSKFIIKNGIKIIDLNWSDEEQEYLVPLEFKVITKFPIGYHDYPNMIVNNTYARMYTEPTSEWNIYPCKVPLDTKRLKLDSLNLTNDHIFSIRLSNKVFTYIILTFRHIKYMIGTDDTEGVFRYKLGKKYQRPYYGDNALEYLGLKCQRNLMKLLKNENINYENFLLI